MTCVISAGLLPTPLSTSGRGLLPTPTPPCRYQAGLLPTPNPACKAGLLPTPTKPEISSAQDAKKILIKKISPAIVKKKLKKVGTNQEKVWREFIWAGPSYMVNSPPPSELPIPKFFLKSEAAP